MACNEAFEMPAFNSTQSTDISGVITSIDGQILVTTVEKKDFQRILSDADELYNMPLGDKPWRFYDVPMNQIEPILSSRDQILSAPGIYVLTRSGKMYQVAVNLAYFQWLTSTGFMSPYMNTAVNSEESVQGKFAAAWNADALSVENAVSAISFGCPQGLVFLVLGCCDNYNTPAVLALLSKNRTSLFQDCEELYRELSAYPRKTIANHELTGPDQLAAEFHRLSIFRHWFEFLGVNEIVTPARRGREEEIATLDNENEQESGVITTDEGWVKVVVQSEGDSPAYPEVTEIKNDPASGRIQLDGYNFYSYTLVRVSNLGQYARNPDKLGNFDEVLSIEKLEDETWEVLIYKSQMPALTDKLRKEVPDCVINPDYNPFEPDAREVKEFGYEGAKLLRTRRFRERAERMIHWPKAAAFYGDLIRGCEKQVAAPDDDEKEMDMHRNEE
ncbi:hypothetical protein BKA65DRAFT_561928 [Rhexocercosporidium sp. MPI-PUGE-AT-0058]|nr:hypothetical protein BKA65DRAFT_561928 [Rhexocercosporidium sp. MPI-PUGE-AT-0058]